MNSSNNKSKSPKNTQKTSFWKYKGIFLTIFAGLVFVLVVYSLNYKTKTNTLNSNINTENNVPISNTSTVEIVNDGNFESIISSGLVVVDFWATWCRPCKMQAPIMDELAQDFNGKVKFAKLDVDENQLTSNKHNVYSIPTLILFKNGKKVETLVGLQSKDNLSNIIKKYL